MRVVPGSITPATNSACRSSITLKKTGHDPFDCGAFTTTPTTPIRRSASPPRLKTVGRPVQPGHRVGRIGNGEPDRREPVPGSQVWRWGGGVTLLPCPPHPTNAQLIGIGRRSHATGRKRCPRRCLLDPPWSEAERHQDVRHPRRIRASHSAPPVPGADGRVAAARRAYPASAWPAHSAAAMAGAPWRSLAPHGRFARGRNPLRTAGLLRRATALGNLCSTTYSGGSTVHVHLACTAPSTEWPTADVAMPLGRCRCGAHGRLPNTAPN